ncbi:hypothetical protein KOI35_30470 [Actinoplanes bogorensis]|uniref:Integral membrane protein n=1 Tax=Paractinoplanes bogorensis TaxID=1610840 RepID=A0ABS5Z0C5_9ACTN|nr:hypothetical protein [Actinoplanes bogorensis]MBU2667845.1 hypothetical protein [Actinoplanes bogorensis]
MTTGLLTCRIPARPLAVVSGVFGLAAGLCFALFAAGRWERAGLAADVLGSVQLITLAPVALALGERMRTERAVRIACVVVAAAAVLTPVLEIVTRQGIWPSAVCSYLIFVWILLVSLTGHRRRSLPRPVTRAGLLIGAALLAGLVLLLPGLVTPEPLRRVFLAAGVGIGVLATAAQPVFTLLLGRHVFKEEP